MNQFRKAQFLIILLVISFLTFVVMISGCKKDDAGPSGVPTSSSIGLSNDTITFTASQGGSNPSIKTVDVTNGGGGSLTGLTDTISYTSGSGWLTASLNTTTAPATITLQAVTGALTAGNYTANVSVASAGASNSPRTISITFTITAPLPSITLSASRIDFSAQYGGGNPSFQTVDVTNGGGGSLIGLSTTISYTSGSGWLTATLNRTTAPASIKLQPTIGSLAEGTYTANVSVTSDGEIQSPKTVSVYFTITPEPTPKVLRIINDLYDQKIDTIDWLLLNTVVSVRVGPSEDYVTTSEGGQKLTYGSIGVPGDTKGILPKYNDTTSYYDIDISGIATDASGNYYVHIQTGYWERDEANGYYVFYTKRFADVMNCLGQVEADNKWAVITVSKPYSDIQVISLKKFLPVTDWYGSSFCK